MIRGMNLPGIEIRPFQKPDLGALRRLILETIDAGYTDLYPPRAVAFFKRFHGEQEILERASKGVILVAERHDDLIATGSLLGNEILAVFVHPACQRCGLGKALMQILESEASASGIRQSTLSVSLASKRFYQDLGYELFEKNAKDVGEGQRLDFWKARKTLAPKTTS